jgi:hypothetical protein
MVDPAVVPPPARVAPVVSQHAYRRIYERLTPSEQADLSRKLQVLEGLRHRFNGHDWGMRLLKLDRQRNDPWGDESNGDEVWAVLRRGELRTVMLRRSSQPGTAEALRVDKVVFL